jgi:stage V sporulation protein G
MAVIRYGNIAVKMEPEATMEISEVRIFLKEGQDRKLKAYATVTFDKAFVVRNIKIIDGTKGLFVAMPSRRLKDPCPKCRHKNVVRSKYCNQCGASLPAYVEPKPPVAGNGREKQSEHKDIAHPITSDFRDYIQKKVLAAYSDETKAPVSARAASGNVPPARIDTSDEDDDIEL